MYTICDDGDEINIRAVITQRWELAELVTKLQQRVDGLPVNITAMTVDGSAVTGISLTSPKSVYRGDGVALYEPDAQDVNRKELSNE